MDSVIRISEGAYFVRSYSEQTVVTFIPGLMTQTIISGSEKPEETESADGRHVHRPFADKRDNARNRQ